MEKEKVYLEKDMTIDMIYPEKDEDIFAGEEPETVSEIEIVAEDAGE